MSRADVRIPTPDGAARAYAFTPAQGQGPWPAVIMYMDAIGVRPALFDMGQRLADGGYYVLVPDMFWRVGDYPPMDAVKVFSDADARTELMTKFMPSTDPQKAVRDTGAFLDWLSKQPQVKGGKVGTVGYCMGGGIAMRAAGAFPDRVAAVAAFHPGNVATDTPDSPHLLAPKIKAKVFVGGADNDAMFDLAQKERLAAAFADAGVDAEVTIFPGALHGYAPYDTAVYNKEASERSWREMNALFADTLT